MMAGADGAVGFLLKKIDHLIHFIKLERNRLGGNKANVDELKVELKAIEAILVQADKEVETRGEARPWRAQVRDLAYDIEDVHDMFIFDTSRRQSTLLLGIFETGWTRIIADFIERVKDKSSSLRARENFGRFSSGGTTFPSHDTYTNLYPRVGALNEADVFGIQEQKSELIAWVKEEQQKRKVMFVVGMGGLGKTLVANQVYEETKQDFDCCAFISVSRFHKKQHLLQIMWGELSETNPVSEECEKSKQVRYFTKKLQDILKDKRYMIVFDDFWSEEVWESVKNALPEQSHGRVIVTTRRGDVAHLSSHDQLVAIYNLRQLTSTEAEKLFHKKAFPSTGQCPQGLSELSKKFREVCEGLPLGLISIGQLLAKTEQTVDAWMQLHDSLGSELEGNGRLYRSITCVLSPSYIDLPFHLKDCLLCFSIFPENHPIKRRKLIRLWIAEGLLDKKPGKTLEQVGEDYLKELIQRNLVLVNDAEFSGRVRTCRLHHLLHKIILSTAQEENFCKVSNDEKVRRLSLHKGCTGLLASRTEFPCARSFFVFGSDREISNLDSENIFSKFSILKVLDLEGAPLNKFPEPIVKLFFIRYLSLKGTKIKKLPKSIGNLQNLETLDLRKTLVTKLPEQIFNLTKLLYLFVSQCNEEEEEEEEDGINSLRGFKASEKIGKLVALQKLSFVKANKDAKMMRALQKLTKLRKLGMVDLRKNDGSLLCGSIEKMAYLQSLDIASCSKDEFLDLTAMGQDNQPKLLQRLCLKGKLQQLPDWVSSLHDLMRIRLKWSKLGSKPLDALQDLPNLMELQLVDAFTEELLVFPAGKFLKLNMLELDNLLTVKLVTMQNGALANLHTLTIRRCEKMRPVLRGIDKLPLKKLLFYDMPEEFVNTLQKNKGQLYFLVQHIPFICSYAGDHRNPLVWTPRELSCAQYETITLSIQDSDLITN